jgi:DNA-binding NarL/FixJ family response regulator
VEREDPSKSDLAPEAVQLLRDGHAFILALPAEERHIAAMAAEGAPIWEIAQQMRVSEAAVANAIDRIVAALSGREVEPIETGGLGADTDPGVSGGYDAEQFGER